MKKVLYLLAVAGILFGFASCNKDKKIDVDYNVTVELDANNVIGRYTPLWAGAFDFDDGELLRLQLFVYDDHGSIVNNYEKIVSYYTTKASFSLNIPEGNYIFIACSSVISKRNGNYVDVWTYSLTDNINSFRADLNMDYYFFDKALLGLKMIEKKIDCGESFIINIESASALVRERWTSVHYWNDVVQYVLYANDIFGAQTDGHEFIYPEQTSINPVSQIRPYLYTANNIVGHTAYLPNHNFKYDLVAFTDSLVIPMTSGTFNINGGKQYDMIIDIPNMDIVINDVVSIPTDNASRKEDSSIRVLDLVVDNPNLFESLEY